jgi:hypothetical protein
MRLKASKGSKQRSREHCKAQTKAGDPCQAPVVERGFDRLRELYNDSNAQAKGSACVRERRFAARRNCYLPLNRSRRIDATGIPQYGQKWTAREKHS